MYSLTRAIAASIVVVFVFGIAARGDDGSVIIEHNPVTATTRTYDPDHPSPQMPPPSSDEAGVTVSAFSCTALVSGTVISQTKTGSVTQVVVRVDTVRLVLHLDVAEWVRQVAEPKILAHENGHRKISEIFYASADDIARAIGRDLIGTTFTASADTPDAAATDALTTAADQAANQYMQRVRDPSETMQVLYDHITAHGTNKVDENDAIDIAFREAALKTRDDPSQPVISHTPPPALPESVSP